MDMEIKDKIRYYRIARELTQVDLAEKSGINVSTIKKYETGVIVPKTDNLLKIAKALDVSIYQFLEFDIQTLGDALSLFQKIAEVIPIWFDIEDAIKYKDHKEDLSIHFDNDAFNHFLYKFLQTQLDAQIMYDHPELEKPSKTFEEAAANALQVKTELGMVPTLISRTNNKHEE